jgi:hypothetical protein
MLRKVGFQPLAQRARRLTARLTSQARENAYMRPAADLQPLTMRVR